jgi:TRAP-type C4-dicarboxylate transport system substrate-binding protein
MKKFLLVFISVLLIIGLVLSGCTSTTTTTPASTTPAATQPTVPATSAVPTSPTSPAPVAAPIKLLYASFDSDQAPDAITVKEWAKELEERSGGRVKVEFSWNSAIGPMPEYYSFVTSGVCDMIAYLSFMRPGLTPVLDVSGLPFAQTDTLSGTRGWLEVLKKGYLDKELSEVKIVMIANTRATTIMTNKQLKTLADFKGLKIHAGTDTMVQVLNALGAIPSNVPPMDIYSALQKNVVNATTGTPVMLDSLKLGEVVKYITPAFCSLAEPYLMNKDFWNKLPPDIQAIIDDMTVEYSEKMAAQHDKANQIAIDSFLAKGGQLVPISETEMTTMDPLLTAVWQKYISDNSAKGIPVKEVADLVWNTIKANGMDRPAVGYTPGK